MLLVVIAYRVVRNVDAAVASGPFDVSIFASVTAVPVAVVIVMIVSTAAVAMMAVADIQQYYSQGKEAGNSSVDKYFIFFRL